MSKLNLPPWDFVLGMALQGWMGAWVFWSWEVVAAGDLLGGAVIGVCAFGLGATAAVVLSRWKDRRGTVFLEECLAAVKKIQPKTDGEETP